MSTHATFLAPVHCCASVRVEGGHYTNHRGDTLGASPKTRERETGMKNFETNFETLVQQCTKTSKCVMEVFLIHNALSDKSKYKKVQ